MIPFIPERAAATWFYPAPGVSWIPARMRIVGRTVVPVARRRVQWRKVARWAALLIAAGILVAAAIYVVFWPLSDVIARHDTAGITGPHHAAALQTARDAALGRLLTFSAGLFAAGALVYTARNFSLSREGQVTDRYTKAIEELGSGALDVRIGGIYALERVARDSSKDHPTVMEVLSAFVREHSHETTDEQHSRERGPAEGMRPDVQAAVTVIGRRDHKRDIQSVDLSRANLYGAYLSRANLSEVNLSRANLSRANLHLANLSRANLYGADLTGAHLGYADLSNANLQSADLTGADPHDANLSNANLTGAIWPDGAAVPDGWQRSDSGLLRGG